jgi:hypothetical protein
MIAYSGARPSVSTAGFAASLIRSEGGRLLRHNGFVTDLISTDSRAFKSAAADDVGAGRHLPQRVQQGRATAGPTFSVSFGQHATMFVPPTISSKPKSQRSEPLGHGPVNPVLTLSSQSGASSATPSANGSPNLADTVARRRACRHQIPARSL